MTTFWELSGMQRQRQRQGKKSIQRKSERQTGIPVPFYPLTGSSQDMSVEEKREEKEKVKGSPQKRFFFFFSACGTKRNKEQLANERERPTDRQRREREREDERREDFLVLPSPSTCTSGQLRSREWRIAFHSDRKNTVEKREKKTCHCGKDATGFQVKLDMFVVD